MSHERRTLRWPFAVMSFIAVAVLTYAALAWFTPRASTEHVVNKKPETYSAQSTTAAAPPSSSARAAPSTTPPWPTPTLELTLDASIPWMNALQARAEAGDLEARAVVLRAQIPCMRPVLSDEEIDSRAKAMLHEDEWSTLPPQLIEQRNSLAQGTRDRLLRERAQCQAAPPIDRARFLAQLTEVLREVDVDWFDNAFNQSIVGDDAFAVVRHAERLVVLQAVYRAQLDRRIASGELNALRVLANALDTGNAFPVDRSAASAYRYALSLVTPDAVPVEPENEDARVLGAEIARRFRQR